MKRLLVVLSLVALTFIGVQAVFADVYISNNPNSGKYNGMLARTASTDIDAAEYNPAGTALMANGLWLSVTDIMFWDRFEVENTNGKSGVKPKYDTKAGSYILPAMQAVFKISDLAVFLAVGIHGGGGSGKALNGSPTIDQKFGTNGNSSVEGTSFVMGTTLGVAYKLHEMISIAIAGRYDTATDTTKIRAFGSLYYDDKQTAYGKCGIASVDIMPTKDLLIAVTYRTSVKLNYTKEVLNENVSGLMGKSGDKARRDLPSMLITGISYKVNPELLVTAGFLYYYQKWANWERIDADQKGGSTPSVGQKIENAYEIPVGFEYTITKGINITGGYAYSYTGTNNTWYGGAEFPVMIQHTVTAGIQWELTTGLIFNFGYAHSFNKTIEGDTKYYNGTAWKVDKDRDAIAFQVTYHMPM